MMMMNSIDRGQCMQSTMQFCWILKPIMLVSLSPFMTELQDPGCVNPQSKEKRTINFPKLQAVANKMFYKLTAGKFPDIPP
jgi:hypothetical protein